MANNSDSEPQKSPRLTSKSDPNTFNYAGAPNTLESMLKDLRKKRGSLKRRLTLFKKYFKSFENITLTVNQAAELKLRTEGAQVLFNEFNQVQSNIENLVSDSEFEAQLEEREAFELEYYSVLARAQCMVKCEEVANNSSYSTAPMNVNMNSIKLPTISIPEFDGSYEHWLEFRDTFSSLVHNCNDITKIQRFHYLKSSLKGNAKSVIDSLEFTANNYDVAWELLLSRFDNVRLLTHNHIKSIFSMPALSKESPAQIRKLIDNVLKNLRALRILGEPTDSWDSLIIYVIVSKLDTVTEREWEQFKSTLITKSSDKVTLDNLITFLRSRADVLETLIVSHSRSTSFSSPPSNYSSSNYNNNYNKQYNSSQKIQKLHCNVVSERVSNKSQSKNNNKKNCLLCSGKHPLYSCQKFLELSSQERFNFVKNNKLCINCMRISGHSAEMCTFGPCRKCEKKHNSLICDSIKEGSNNTHTFALVATEQGQLSQSADIQSTTMPNKECISGDIQTQIDTIQVHSAHTDTQLQPGQLVLLSTAIVQIRDQSGNYHEARAVLDSGSERCFITRTLCDILQLPKIQSTHQIRGVGSSITQCSQSCSIEIKSHNDTFVTSVQCLVLPKITSRLPSMTFDVSKLNIPENILLADPYFFQSQPIDLLIGADIFWELINEGKIRLNNGPYLQNTRLGWIVSGTIYTNNRKGVNDVSCNFTQSVNDEVHSLDKLVRQFWELEELPTISESTCTDDERACEEHFIKTTKRAADGRFIVQIPFKQSPEKLGNSLKQAERRFYALEKRLDQNPAYKQMYHDFIHEYIDLGHMSRIHSYGTPNFFMPHHGVFREHATTTKLRTVFDASMVSSSGVSLNNLQLVGPPIQGDLLSILLRFRENRYVACADVEKMYRQVLIAEDQRDLQLILWRDHHSHPLGLYQLNTVTYGTASAPFLSCRCLKQLGQECDNLEIAQAIIDDFYVDDLIIGAASKPKLNELCHGITQVLKTACFPLRKWVFNFHVESDNTNEAQDISKELALGEHVHTKTLGLGWYNKSDNLHFHTQIKNNSQSHNVTKRVILSKAAQIYDPLGILSPFIMLAKSLLQKCWLLKLDWDEPVPNDIAHTWSKFIDECLLILHSIRVPRYVMCNDPSYIEMHIFTDASQVGYGACAYIRSVDSKSMSVTVRLLCSKGKVAPTRPLTIPRLELCGAVIGARLYSKIIKSLRSKLSRVLFWTDSTIVLGWLGTPPNMLKPYVQNRIAEIHELTGEHSWRHVSGKENPADLLSRGSGLNTLCNSPLWWEGPKYLHETHFEITTFEKKILPTDLPEIKSKIHSHVVQQTHDDSLFPFSRFSQLNRIQRATAYILRFIHNARSKQPDRYTGPLTVKELDESLLTLARLSQHESFSDLYDSLNKRKSIRDKQLSKLNLFVDSANKMIRVGGRIGNAEHFNYDKKHQILLSSKHNLTLLLFRHEHKQTMHGGPQLLLFTMRERWWPVGGRGLARRVVHACVTCARLRASTTAPIMGNLPAERLQPGFPFLHCGVDYAGPVLTLNRKGRGAKTQKSYICLFICFVTRAIHLELVSDLSTDAYLLALKRFISRRGKPSEIFSDNGKNFVGLMNNFKNFLSSCSDEIKKYAVSQSIKFNMIPVYASHFGGLWEAGVKSCKHHLRRVVGNAHLTFEEFSTVLSQVEAILNSRPLSPMSTDPQDLLPLTPAHFLVGRPLTAPASTDLRDVTSNRLTRYQRVEQIRQHFWARWAKEYVSELQTRTKWQQHKNEVQENMLVVIKDDNQPPLKWSMGRIVKTYPGKDGVSRVADIRTANGVVRRAFSKICPLPTAESSGLEAAASKAGQNVHAPRISRDITTSKRSPIGLP